MQSKEQRHSEMLTAFVKSTNVRNLLPQFRQLRKKFNELESEKPLSKNPFIDEVDISGRLLNLIYTYFEVYVPGYAGEPERLHYIQVSDLPDLEQIKALKRGFGYKSQQEYADLLKKYRNN